MGKATRTVLCVAAAILLLPLAAAATPTPVDPAAQFYVPRSGDDAMLRLLSLPEPPTAVFAASDLTAVGAVQAARERGLTMPGDLAVVGFDDIPIAALVDPPLTTIRQDKQGLGSAATAALPVELVVRRSS